MNLIGYPKNRKDAREQKSKFYCTGVPCSNHGHICLRYTCNGRCLFCHKQYHDKNRELILKEMKKYRDSNSESLSLLWKNWYKKNSSKHKERNKEYRKNNLQTLKEKDSLYYIKNSKSVKYRARIWYYNNRERAVANAKKWSESNREKVRFYSRVNSNNRRKAEGRHTKEDIDKLYCLQKGKCANCKISVGKKYHVDHIMPIFLGGSNYSKNLQILCPKCNLKKSSKHPIDWAQENGRLL